MNIPEDHFHLLADHPEELAFDLYYQLRKADAADVQIIAIELPQKQEVGKECGNVF